MPQISVIVPVYKVEPYLHRCVDSILGQTFSDFELILVDDGSPDHCPAICDEYTRKDSRVIVIHQKNGGLSAARNAGIDWVLANSDSQWFSFVDSDDWVHPEYLECLLNAALKFGADISICDYAKTCGEEPIIDEDMPAAMLWHTEEFYVEKTINATIAWGKLYQRRCFQTIRYPLKKLHEDEYTTYQILFRYDVLVWIDVPLYFYYHSQDSITTSEWTPRRMDALAALDEQLDFFIRHGYSAALKRRVQSYLWMLYSQYHGAVTAKKDYTAEIRRIRKRMKHILRRYAQQIDSEWPEYVAVTEIVCPIRGRIHKLFGRL